MKKQAVVVVYCIFEKMSVRKAWGMDEWMKRVRILPSQKSLLSRQKKKKNITFSYTSSLFSSQIKYFSNVQELPDENMFKKGKNRILSLFLTLRWLPEFSWLSRKEKEFFFLRWFKYIKVHKQIHTRIKRLTLKPARKSKHKKWWVLSKQMFSFWRLTFCSSMTCTYTVGDKLIGPCRTVLCLEKLYFLPKGVIDLYIGNFL